MEMIINIVIGLCTMGFFSWLGWRIARASLKRSDEPAALVLRWIVSAVLIGGWCYGVSKFLASGFIIFMSRSLP